MSADNSEPTVVSGLSLQRLVVIGAAMAIASALPVLLLNLWESSLAEGTRWVPAVARARSYSLALVLVPLAVMAWLVARRAWSTLLALPRQRRILWLVGLALAQLVLAAAGFWAGVFTQKNWLFPPPPPFAAQPSPDGRRTAYATQLCLIGCSVEVHVRDGSGLLMHRVHTYPSVRGDHAHIVWHDNTPESVEVLGLTPFTPPGSAFGGWH